MVGDLRPLRLQTYARCVQAPEAFDSDRLRNLVRGEWRRIGIPGDHVNSVDGTPIPGPPLVNRDEAVAAVDFAVGEHTCGPGSTSTYAGRGCPTRSTR
jgi:hypothetical protein